MDGKELEGVKKSGLVELFELLCALLVLGAPFGWIGYVVTAIFFYLRDGTLGPEPFSLRLLKMAGIRIQWLEQPESWIGLHNVILLLLNLFGPVGFICIPFFLIMILKDDK